MMRVVAAIVLATAMLLVGCGGSGDGDGPEPVSELARLVPENPFGVSEVDLVALKDALGLPADADPAAPPEGEAGRRLTSVARAVVPFCHGVEPPEPIDVAIRQAVDCSQIQAAAAPAGVGLWSLTIMRTEQPFDEIADSLTAAGYSRQGRLLGYPGGTTPMRYAEVVAGADDETLIALARDRTAGFAALGEAPAAPDARPELSALGALTAAPARTARLGNGECVAAYAIADQIADDRGELVVQLASEEAEATPNGFTLDEHEGFASRPGASELFDFGQPEADGGTLQVSFGLREGEAREVGAIAAFDELAFSDPYEC